MVYHMFTRYCNYSEHALNEGKSLGCEMLAMLVENEFGPMPISHGLTGAHLTFSPASLGETQSASILIMFTGIQIILLDINLLLRQFVNVHLFYF